MRIAVLGHLRHPIAAPFMGGMESHCHMLVEALAAAGHAVTLFASGDSDPALPLVPVMPRHYEASLPFARWQGTPQLAACLDDAFSRAWAMVRGGGFDVVHSNAMHPALHDWALADGQPMVTSLHVPPFQALSDAVARTAAPWLRQTCTSRAHLASWSNRPPGTMSVVHNGIAVERWPFRAQGNGRAVWCGRITPNKGTAVALKAARAARVPIDLAGPIDDQDYFRIEVASLLGEDAVYLGHVAGDALAEVLGRASVLVATPMWDEPFGLVAVEAMACGVPVAALGRGALREVVGTCGAFAGSPDDLPAAIAAALSVPRARCRARVERHFSIARMIDGYEAAYAAAMSGCRASSTASASALLA